MKDFSWFLPIADSVEFSFAAKALLISSIFCFSASWVWGEFLNSLKPSLFKIWFVRSRSLAFCSAVLFTTAFKAFFSATKAWIVASFAASWASKFVKFVFTLVSIALVLPYTQYILQLQLILLNQIQADLLNQIQADHWNQRNQVH